MSETVDLAAALVRCATAYPPGDELCAAEVVARFLDVPGVEVELQPLDERRANLVARLRGSGQRPSLVFCGHLDTVPVGPGAWSSDALGGEVRDGRLWGRGSADMKGAIAAMAVALRELAASGQVPRGDVVLALTAGEETDSCGARLMAESGIVDDAGMMVVGEMTGLDVGCAHKGLLWVQVETTGQRGHGSVVGREGNAIAALMAWLHPLESLDALVSGEHLLLGRGSVSVNQIDGGDAPNVVPGAARAVLDVRTLPVHDHAGILRALGERGDAATLSVLREGTPVATDPGHPLVRACADAVREELGRPAVVKGLPYLTDASVFVEALDIPVVILGPGQEAQAHGVDESVAVAALEQATRIYRAIAQRLLEPV